MVSQQRVFQGGQIAGDDGPLREADVLVNADGVIEAVDANLPVPPGAEVVDCRSRILLPGFFDIHVHVREPGREDKETIQTGSEAAINGGVTRFLAMPNTTPAIDTGAWVRFVHTVARDHSRIPVMTSGCITKNREGLVLAEIAEMHAQGARMITDDGSPIGNSYVLRRAMEYAKNFNLIVASHCETMSLSGDGAMNEGSVSYRLGIPGIPSISEEISIDHDCRIAQYTGGRLHIQHVTTARGMDTIARYKNEGVNVTCEVSPHHLIFNEEDIVDYNTHYKMNPPLRTAEDNERLLQGLQDGIFDALATDHAPHTEIDKSTDFASAPFGITGLETAVLSMYDKFIQSGRIGWDLLVKRYATEPRKLLGLDRVAVEVGRAAELVVFDPNATTRIDRSFMKSKSINTPFLDQTLNGSIEKVFLGADCLLDRSRQKDQLI
jgi:dihydroorotase